MAGLLKKTVLGVTLAASTLAATAPADAQYRGGRGYRGYRHDGIGAGGAAVLGGLLGLGVGAAIASGNRDRYDDRGYAYDRGYYRAPPRVIYRERYYARPPVVVYREYDRRGYYGRGYPGGYYGY